MAVTQILLLAASIALVASAPAADDTTQASNATSPSAAPGEAHTPLVNASSFTCYNRLVGYYADIEQGCSVYHFCFPGEYHQQILYQRISYLCLNDTIFDQQALDCVESAKLTAPCKESDKYYEASNQVLRQALLSKPAQDMAPTSTGAASPTTTTTPAAPLSSSPSATEAPKAATAPTTTTPVAPAADASSTTEAPKPAA